MDRDYHCPDSFEEFCVTFGYDISDDEASEIFKSRQDRKARLRCLFTNEDMDRFGFELEKMEKSLYRADRKKRREIERRNGVAAT